MKKGLGIAACTMAIVFLVLGLIFKNEGEFSDDYVKDQLSEHGIVFTPAEALLPNQKDVPCLVKNAGKPLTTGKQAECYAKYQIGLDLALVDEGKTYFQSHYNGYLARMAWITAMQSAPNDPATLELKAAADAQSRKADDLLAGEATKGLLLTGYTFSVIGDRLLMASNVLFVLAGISLIVGIVLLIFGFRKPKDPEPVAAPAVA